VPITAPPPSGRSYSHLSKILYAGCTTYYVLNSGVTDPNFTKFLYKKWYPITLLKLKLRYSTLFRDASLPNEGRSSNCGGVAGKIAHFNSVICEIVGRKLAKCVHHVARLLSSNLLRAASRSSNPLANARANSEGRSWRRMRMAPNVIGCHSNVPWATVKRLSD